MEVIKINELTTMQKQLPDNLPDLSRFVLVGREKLNAVRAEIRAIDKVGLAQEVRDQKLHEAQDIADAVLDAEMKIGELMAEVPKATKDNARKQKDSGVDLIKPKTEVIKEAGLTPKQVERFQTIAKHPEAVEKAKEEARKNDEVVTRSAVLKKVKESKKPHIVNNSGDDEWYTPAEYIESAREVMGTIDLDPASNDFANRTVRASEYYTAETNGLEREWYGNVWLNPPYSTSLIKQFADKVAESNFEQAVVLVNNATETVWFRRLLEKATAIIFPTGRIRFEKTDGAKNVPLQGQAFIYYGEQPEKFLAVFGKYGWGARL